MKKATFLVFLLLCLTFGAVNASAAFEADANFNVSYEQDAENIIITAYFSDIRVKDGIISVEYDIEYDHTALELVSVKHQIPQKWESLISEENVENFSSQVDSGVYHWGYAVISLGEGAKNDKELGFIVEFKPLKESVSEIKINYSDLRGEVLENGATKEFVHMSANSAKISYDFTNAVNTKLYYADIDAEMSFLRPKYYEVENRVVTLFEEEASTDTDKSDESNAIVYICICVAVVIVAAAVVLLIFKIKRTKRND